jgi:hypothetical protein
MFVPPGVSGCARPTNSAASLLRPNRSSRPAQGRRARTRIRAQSRRVLIQETNSGLSGGPDGTGRTRAWTTAQVTALDGTDWTFGNRLLPPFGPAGTWVTRSRSTPPGLSRHRVLRPIQPPGQLVGWFARRATRRGRRRRTGTGAYAGVKRKRTSWTGHHVVDGSPDSPQVSGLGRTGWTLRASLWSCVLQVRVLPPEPENAWSGGTSARSLCRHRCSTGLPRRFPRLPTRPELAASVDARESLQGERSLRSRRRSRGSRP